MKTIGILWNSMNDLRNEAITDIKKYAIIDNMICIDLKEKYFES